MLIRFVCFHIHFLSKSMLKGIFVEKYSLFRLKFLISLCKKCYFRVHDHADEEHARAIKEHAIVHFWKREQIDVVFRKWCQR